MLQRREILRRTRAEVGAPFQRLARRVFGRAALEKDAFPQVAQLLKGGVGRAGILVQLREAEVRQLRRIPELSSRTLAFARIAAIN
jgi:hypothetical protein